MRSEALRVPRERGERTRRALLELEALRVDLRIVGDGGSLLFPVRGELARLESLGELTVAEFRSFDDLDAPRRYQELLELPADRQARLPRAFDVVGDIVLIRLPRDLEADAPAVGDALLQFVPGARLVGADYGVHGPERLRSLRRIAGSGAWRTVHRENGIAFEVDVERAYFSPRLAREHARVADCVRPGERVYDLGCGVGPFSITIASQQRARRIVAIDHNPAAIELLEATVHHLGLPALVEAHVASIDDFLLGAEPCERAILNLPQGGIKYLTSVAGAVEPGGTVHYYERVERSELARRGDELVQAIDGGSLWSAAEPRIVHPYSPTSDVVAFALHRARPAVEP